MELVWFCAPMTGGSGWVFDPAQVGALAVVTGLYAFGSRRASSRGVTVGWWRHGVFALGIGMLVVALVSPIHFASGERLSAHMVQHSLLMLAPLALVISRAGTRNLQALPARLRGRIGRYLHPLLRRFTPIPALVLLLVVAIGWHIPFFLDAALVNPLLHIFQHVTLVGASALFWTALIRHRSSGTALISVFLLMVVGGAFGALITFSSVALYPGYAIRAPMYGVDWHADQQLAGVVMWVPMGAILMALGAWLAYELLTGLTRRGSRQRSAQTVQNR